MRSITCLEIECDQVTGARLKYIASMSQLRDLTLGHNNRIADADLEYIGDMTNLERFELFSNQITDVGASCLRMLRKLQFLTLVSGEITDAGVSQLNLVQFPLPLRSFEIGGPKVTDASLEDLKNCPQLSELSLMHNTIRGDGLKDPGLMSVMRLSLSGATDETLEHIAEQRHLFHLVLYSPNFTRVGLSRLSAAPNLRALSLCDFTDENVKLAAGLTKLERLYLFRPRTPNAGLEHLAKSPPSNLQQLFVSDVNDEGLRYVGEIRRLKELELYKPRFTDAGLKHLKKLLNLEFLSMYLEPPSKVRVENARRALPKCDVWCNDWEDNFLSESYLETH
jgi:Leucine-rich repeat (LRR) protein